MKKLNLLAIAILFVQLQAIAQQQKESDAALNYTTQKSNFVDWLNLKNERSKIITSNSNEKDYAYYLQKKKNNLTAGLVTLGAGVVLSGVGLIISTNSNSFDNDATAGVLVIAGAASGIASIPLMIMASVYGHKAKLELSNQKTGFGAPSKVSKNIPGLTISIPLGK